MSYDPDCAVCRANRAIGAPPCNVYGHRSYRTVTVPLHARLAAELASYRGRAMFATLRHRENGWPMAGEAEFASDRARRMAWALTELGTPSYLPEAIR